MFLLMNIKVWRCGMSRYPARQDRFLQTKYNNFHFLEFRANCRFETAESVLIFYRKKTILSLIEQKVALL